MRRSALAVLIVPPLVLLAACSGGGGTREQPSASPGARDPQARRLDPVAVSDLRERAVALLTKAASADSPQLRANALEGLSAAGARVDPLIPAGLADQNEGVRTVAAMIVGRLRLTGHSAALVHLRTDASLHVRAAAIYAAARTGSNSDISPLAGLLYTAPSYRARAQVVFILGELGNRSAAKVIGGAADAPVPSGQEGEARLFLLQVSEALVKLGFDDQREVLHAALYPAQAVDLEATALAAQAVGQLRDKTAVGDLVNLVEFKDSAGNMMPAEVRLAAAAALARLGQPHGTYIADQYRQSENAAHRAQAAALYGDLALNENLPKLEAMLADPSGMVAVSAAAAILRATRG